MFSQRIQLIIIPISSQIRVITRTSTFQVSLWAIRIFKKVYHERLEVLLCYAALHEGGVYLIIFCSGRKVYCFVFFSQDGEIAMHVSYNYGSQQYCNNFQKGRILKTVYEIGS